MIDIMLPRTERNFHHAKISVRNLVSQDCSRGIRRSYLYRTISTIFSYLLYW